MAYNIPEDLKYTREHEWIALKEDDVIVLGLTDYAQDQLEDIVYLDLPEPGMELSEGDAFGSVEANLALPPSPARPLASNPKRQYNV